MLTALLVVAIAFVSSVGAHLEGAPAVQAQTAPVGAGFNLDASDLRFILAQIRIAEAHAAGGTLLGPGANQVNEPRLPFGLRTVDGSFNHLLPGQEQFGAADRTFPRLTAPLFRLAETWPFDPDGPGPIQVGDPTSYAQTTGLVNDSQPRTISNLIVDQTVTNPAAVTAAGPGCTIPGETCFIPNVAPDVGLSAPFNSVFTFFGQFFDHGLDLVNKGGSGTVFVPLQPDDPLFVPGSPTNFMVLTRATNLPGPDGRVGDDPATPQDESADDVHEGINQTTPFVDQNQTYTSHPSHQVFLREYVMGPGPDGILADDPGTPADEAADNRPVATGRLIDGAVAGNIGNWSEVKAQAAAMLGIQLADSDVLNVPLLATDPYGRFLRGPNGFPMLALPGGLFAEGSPLAPISTLGALRTNHAFLDDIAHHAVPGTFDHDGNPATPKVPKTPDGDPGMTDDLNPATYDDELLNAHFITGDGRGNENIALTAVHTVFHAEHNRLREDIDALIHSALTPAEIAEWEAAAAQPPLGSGWAYGERLFQAARFVTEMEYQHLVFEEFARKLVPLINVFIGDGINFQSDINPAIPAEFAHAVYRLGHSMLTETIARTNPDGSNNDIALLGAFLNPAAFNSGGPAGPLTGGQAAGSILQGLSRQVGNEIDEFVTEAVRNKLLGLPLDLAAINLARGRSEGVPPLNNVRRQLFATSGRPELAPYASWAEFSFELKHQESLVNFLAAYGTHPDIASAITMAQKRLAAQQIIDGPSPGPDGIRGDNPLTTNADESADDTPPGPGPDGVLGDDPLTPLVDESLDDTPANPGPDGIFGDNPLTTNADESLDDIGPDDSLDFLFSTGAWANVGGATVTGLDSVDLWIGGLAEKQAPFGSLLGTTFNYVFEITLENLQNADRFYYLERLDGLNLLVQLEGNSLAELVMRNTSAVGLPADIFSRADLVFNLANLGTSGPILDDPTTPDNEAAMPDLIRMPDGTIRYTGPLHVVWNGRDTAAIDRVRSSEGDDTLRGNGGRDIMEGGAGNDQFVGGLGDDILTDTFGDDVLKGGDGNDVLSSGAGFDLNQGGRGNDFIVGGSDGTETFGGAGNDFIYAGEAEDTVFGDHGDDWIEGGAQLDLLQGDQGNQFQNDPNGGHDVLMGGPGDDDYDAEGGDDIMIGDGLGTERFEGMLGFDWVTYRGDALPVDADMLITGVFLAFPNINELRDRFDLTEGLSGWQFNDILRGDNRTAADLANGAFGTVPGGHVLNAAGIARIAGLAALLPAGATSFSAGNIILGGAGSDTIEGRGGDDIIDGDAWLNVQLQAPDLANPGGTRLADTMSQLRAQVLAGLINPGDITIVRSIVTTGASPTDIDTALFSAPRSEYLIVANTDGSVTVAHVGAVGALNDGTDTLWNIERLSFCDVPGPVAGTCALRTDTVNAPVAGVLPSLLAFGSVNTGSTSASQSITVSNTGTADLVVSSVTILGADASSFGIAASTCGTVAQAASCTVDVTFSPTTVGAKTATVSIAHNAAGSPASVSLTGTGTDPGPALGLLRVTTNPGVPAQVLVNGIPMDDWALNWVKLPPGIYTVAFSDLQGFTTPDFQVVTVTANATTTVQGDFIQRGNLRVVTSPPVPSTITVDGVERNDWGVWTDLPVGSYQVCFGAVADFDTPACELANLTAGATTVITGTFTPNVGAPGPAAGFGLLRVETSPAVPSQILVDGVPRTDWGLDWVKLPPGTYTVSFGGVKDFTAPAAQVVTVTAGNTTVVTGTFITRGWLRAVTSPPVPGTISVDGLPRDDWGMWTSFEPGTYQVCFSTAPGFTGTPACESAVVTAGVLTTVTGTYTP